MDKAKPFMMLTSSSSKHAVLIGFIDEAVADDDAGVATPSNAPDQCILLCVLFLNGPVPGIG